MHGSGISSNCLWHHMAYAQFVIINMLLGFSAYSLRLQFALSLSLSLPASFFSFYSFSHPVNLSNNLLRLPRVPFFHRRRRRRRHRRCAVVSPPYHANPSHHDLSLSAWFKLSPPVACFFCLHISYIYFFKKLNFAALFA